jgi:hypothetical protein
LLLIAPVCGRRKPQYTFLNVPEETKNSSHYSDSNEAQRSTSVVTELKETRLKNIVERPSKSLSKVKFDVMLGILPFSIYWVDQMLHFMQSNECTLGPRECILIVGWRPKIIDMIREYDNYLGPGSVLVCIDTCVIRNKYTALTL